MGKLTISMAIFNSYVTVITSKMAIEIVDLPINSMVIFHSYVTNYLENCHF